MTGRPSTRRCPRGTPTAVSTGSPPSRGRQLCLGERLQLLLPRRQLALALGLTLRLAVLLVGAVAAVGAAGDGAEHAVMAGIMAGDAADRGAFQAAFCHGGGCGCERGDGEDGGEGFYHGGLRMGVAEITADEAFQFRATLTLPWRGRVGEHR